MWVKLHLHSVGDSPTRGLARDLRRVEQRSYFLHLHVITLHAETRHFISHAQCVIRNALVSPNLLRQLRSRSRPLIPALLEGLTLGRC